MFLYFLLSPRFSLYFLKKKETSSLYRVDGQLVTRTVSQTAFHTAAHLWSHLDLLLPICEPFWGLEETNQLLSDFSLSLAFIDACHDSAHAHLFNETLRLLSSVCLLCVQGLLMISVQSCRYQMDLKERDREPRTRPPWPEQGSNNSIYCNIFKYIAIYSNKSQEETKPQPSAGFLCLEQSIVTIQRVLHLHTSLWVPAHFVQHHNQASQIIPKLYFP